MIETVVVTEVVEIPTEHIVAAETNVVSVVESPGTDILLVTVDAAPSVIEVA